VKMTASFFIQSKQEDRNNDKTNEKRPFFMKKE